MTAAAQRAVAAGACLAALQALAAERPAAPSDRVERQSAYAAAGGVAINIDGDWNTVTVTTVDRETRGIINTLLADTRRLRSAQQRQDAAATAQRRELTNMAQMALRVADLESAVSRLLAAARAPVADDGARQAVVALKEGDTAPLALLLGRQEQQAARRLRQPAAVDRAGTGNATTDSTAGAAASPSAPPSTTGITETSSATIAAATPRATDGDTGTAGTAGSTGPPSASGPASTAGTAGGPTADLRLVAELAREQGAVASLTDSAAALQAYQRAVDYTPRDPLALMNLGAAQLDTGSLDAASEKFAQARTLAQDRLAANPADAQAAHIMVMLAIRRGGVFAARGHRTAALAAYEEGLASATAPGRLPREDTRRASDVATLHYRIGDLSLERGHFDQALASYTRALRINEPLADQSRNTAWILQKIGYVRSLQGHHREALDMFGRALGIRSKLARADPRNAELQRELSISHQMTGDGLAALGDRNGALKAYEEAERITQRLLDRDDPPSRWRRDMARIHTNIGDLLVSERARVPEATGHYRTALRMRGDLVRLDRGNADWQRDLGISHRKLGNALLASADAAGALREFRQAMVVQESLVRLDPENTRWKADLAFTCWRMSRVRHLQSRDERRALLDRSIAILAPLSADGMLSDYQNSLLRAVQNERQQLN
ncbi:tetratricopeptide repeat protein [Cupriavidus respiraculi]|uniref:tetratricopeptide repeat protein n=1 Tax=Cupriavidus respiraculi TaxID=195930 RepID=UPI001C973F57|nr:tetratricopeptide repeat protein [Cupriavidus respiraculi]MBY4945161.1 tetratricopeptide repeat protein [Cupriavidus respiraculi]